MKSRARMGLFSAVAVSLAGTLIWRKREAASAWLINLEELSREPRYLLGGLKTADGFLRYIREHRTDVALVFYSANEVAAERDIFHNAGEPMPLASTMKVLVLAAYAREVVAGRLDPEEQVSVRDWQRYYLPGTDGGAHAEALKRLGLSTGGIGDAKRAPETVTFDEVVRAMIRESDNAATDHVLDRVGTEAMNAIIENAGMRDHDTITSLLGEDLCISNHENPTLTDERLMSLLSLSPEEYRRTTEEMARKYLDTPWGEAERRFRSSGAPALKRRNDTVAYQRLTPKGTAGDYARIMADVVTGEFISLEVSEIMCSHLEWPMQEPANRERFYAFGAKGGSLPGVLTEAWYLMPRFGGFAGKTRVVALFVRGMPLSAWLRSSQTYAQKISLCGPQWTKDSPVWSEKRCDG